MPTFRRSLPFAVLSIMVAVFFGLSLSACASKEPKKQVDYDAIKARATDNFDELDDKPRSKPKAKEQVEKKVAKAEEPKAAPEAVDEPIPAWVSLKPGEGKVIGEFEGGNTKTDSIRVAKNKAFSELAMRCGVTVASTLEIKDEADSSGNSTYEIKDKSQLFAVPIKIERFEFEEVFARKEDGGWHAWALLAIPAEEFARIKRNLDGLVAWYFECDASNAPKNAKDLCANPNFIKKFRELAVSKNIKLRKDMLREAPVDIKDLARSEGVAYYLYFNMALEKTFLDDPEHYVWTNLTWRLIHTDKGAPLKDLTVGPIKGGHYSWEDATKVSFNNALEELKTQLDYADSSY